ncbi:FAD-dependent monooxygenase [Alcanivorax sp. JB21]|uniref:FAD-dependent monooxygenase n=1 Tax=Alcanivorax limicola TaxID=2874102 RepID=UPI001CC06BB4|nr:FAD-dependent monooxygenase [Alcanivorax limicola]MBZ2189159.1 FAD-dependent monooxygenase [Alcanivorax limicola]
MTSDRTRNQTRGLAFDVPDQHQGERPAPSGIVIVGGGMAGLALALLLRHHGQSAVTLIEAVSLAQGEQLDTPSFDARSTALSAGTLAIFAALGLSEGLLSRAAAIQAVDVSRRQRLGSTRMSASEEGLAQLGAVVENRWLGQTLLEAVRADAGIRLIAPARVTQTRRLKQGYALHFVRQDASAQPEKIECALLVAADGAGSRMRDALGIAAHSDDTGHDALIANIGLSESCPEEADGVAWERFLDSGPLALLPLPGRRMALVWTGPRSLIDRLEALPEADFLAELEQAFGLDRLGRFARAGARQRYPLVLTHACAQAVPHGVVVGNAAHNLHPVAGQGFNLTLRDLALLAETLGATDCPGDLSLLNDYVSRREGDQALIRQASRWLPELFRVRFGPFAHTRQLGLVALTLWPGLRSQFAARAMGLAN